MMNLNPVKASAMLCLLTIVACRKSNDDNNLAGKGGNNTVTTTLAHHNISKNITGATVYVKYNTLDAPANGAYDDSITCSIVNEIPTAIFTNLNKGNYYFYAEGYDVSVAKPVLGGTKLQISDGEPNYNLPLAVSDGD